MSLNLDSSIRVGMYWLICNVLLNMSNAPQQSPLDALYGRAESYNYAKMSFTILRA